MKRSDSGKPSITIFIPMAGTLITRTYLALDGTGLTRDGCPWLQPFLEDSSLRAYTDAYSTPGALVLVNEGLFVVHTYCSHGAISGADATT